MGKLCDLLLSTPLLPYPLCLNPISTLNILVMASMPHSMGITFACLLAVTMTNLLST